MITHVLQKDWETRHECFPDIIMNEKIFDQYILNTGLVNKKQLRQAKKYDQDLFVEESLEKLEFTTIDEIYSEISQNLGHIS